MNIPVAMAVVKIVTRHRAKRRTIPTWRAEDGRHGNLPGGTAPHPRLRSLVSGTEEAVCKFAKVLSILTPVMLYT